MSRTDHHRTAAELLALARSLAAERGYRIFGELIDTGAVEFGLEGKTGAFRSEVQVSSGGMLTVLTSNGYEFIDISNDWEVDGTPTPQVRRAMAIFDAFVAGDFRFTNGWRKPNKYMEFSSGSLPVGRSTRHGIGHHRGGPYRRAETSS